MFPLPHLPPYTSAPPPIRPHLQLLSRSEDSYPHPPPPPPPPPPSFPSTPSSSSSSSSSSPPLSSTSVSSSSPFFFPYASTSPSTPPSAVHAASALPFPPFSPSFSAVAVEYVRELSRLSGGEWLVLGLDVALLHRHFLLLRLPSDTPALFLAPPPSLSSSSSSVTAAATTRRSFLDLLHFEVDRVSAFASARSRDCAHRLDRWMASAQQWMQSTTPLERLTQLSTAVGLPISGEEQRGEASDAPSPSPYAASLVSLWQCVDSLRRFVLLSSLAQWRLLSCYVDTAGPKPTDLIAAVAYLRGRNIGDADYLDHLVQRLTALLVHLVPAPPQKEEEEDDSEALSCSCCTRRVDGEAVRLSCSHSVCFRCLLTLVQQCGGACPSCADRPLRMSEVRIDSLKASLLRRRGDWEEDETATGPASSTVLPASGALLRDNASGGSALPSTPSASTAHPLDAVDVPARTVRRGGKRRTAATAVAALRCRSLRRATTATEEGQRNRKGKRAPLAALTTHSAAEAANHPISPPQPTVLLHSPPQNSRIYSFPLTASTPSQGGSIRAWPTPTSLPIEAELGSSRSDAFAALDLALDSRMLDPGQLLSGLAPPASFTHVPLLPSSCHQCKTTKGWSELRYCSAKARQFAGRLRRCRKKYCDACLSRSYDASVMEYDAQWKCPACRDLCVCAACQRRPHEKVTMEDGQQQRTAVTAQVDTQVKRSPPLQPASMTDRSFTSTTPPALSSSVSPHYSDSSQSSSYHSLAAEHLLSPSSSSSANSSPSCAPLVSSCGAVEGASPSDDVAEVDGLHSMSALTENSLSVPGGVAKRMRRSITSPALQRLPPARVQGTSWLPLSPPQPTPLASHSALLSAARSSGLSSTLPPRTPQSEPLESHQWSTHSPTPWSATASTADSASSQPLDSPATSSRTPSARTAEELAWAAIRGSGQSSYSHSRMQTADGGPAVDGARRSHQPSPSSFDLSMEASPDDPSSPVSAMPSHAELALLRLQSPGPPLARWPQVEPQRRVAQPLQRPTVARRGGAASHHRRAASDELHLAVSTMRRGLMEDRHQRQHPHTNHFHTRAASPAPPRPALPTHRLFPPPQDRDLWPSSGLTEDAQGALGELDDEAGDVAFFDARTEPLFQSGTHSPAPPTAPHLTLDFSHFSPPTRYAGFATSSCPPYDCTHVDDIHHDAEGMLWDTAHERQAVHETDNAEASGHL